MSNRFLRLIRVKQWIKNFFVFAPIIFSQKFMEITSVKLAFLAFLAFCCSSAIIYVINDLVDIEKDKHHPSKSKIRPLASGEISLKEAYFAIFLLSAALAAFLIYLSNNRVVILILSYIGLNIAYSSLLKMQPVIELFVVAFGFLLRVYAGAFAIDVPVSPWMTMTVLSIALYLVTIKRRQEQLLHSAQIRGVLKEYSEQILSHYIHISATSALTFYSVFVTTVKSPMIFTVPVAFWIVFRYWFTVEQQKKGESPEELILGDPQLITALLLWVLMSIAFLLPEFVI
ncbi:MAG: UbiA prenyltransferase family protein [Patescibacteria group bacterium]|nr:UbiA prenyltransferase family protein [Patescibacteria group bacterium]